MNATSKCERMHFADDWFGTDRARAEVENQIAQAIRAVSFDQVNGLMVEAHRDMVVLKGQTARYRWKKAAQDVAIDLLGSVKLLNEIEVSGY